MRKLLLLGVLLGLAGCNNDGRPHQIVCIDPKSGSLSRVIDTPGNVVATVVEGVSVLAYYDKNHKTQVVILRQNDCVID